jgi:hypothetical protein
MQTFLSKNVREDHEGDTGAVETVNLLVISSIKKEGLRMLNAVIWLRTASSDELL